MIDVKLCYFKYKGDKNMNIPLTDAIVIAVTEMINDARGETRKPSHYDLSYEIERVGLKEVDPKNEGKAVGKAKRVKTVLDWAMDNNYEAGEKLVKRIIESVRGVGGFRKENPNYIGAHVVENIRGVLKTVGVALGEDGIITPVIIDNLSMVEQQQALKVYIQRAKRGAEDAALLVGTSKDLLEAVAAHILQVKWGSSPSIMGFPTLLGQAFTALGLATTSTPKTQGEQVQKRVERAFYETGCAVNQLRNKQGTGHGHPFLSTIRPEEGKAAIEAMGVIAEYMISKL